MNDELPEIFDEQRPRPAPPALRTRVLAAVERELTRHKKPRWERALEWGVAACLLVGIGWNAWQWESQTPWQRVAAPASAAGSTRYADRPAFGDERLADFVNKRLAGGRGRHDRAAAFGQAYEKLLQQAAQPSAG